MPPPGECAVHLRTPAMAAAPREGETKIAVRERASWRFYGEGATRGYTWLARRQTCWRTRAIREGIVAVGDAATGRVHRAFEDAGDGHGAERGGNENGGAREGELADVGEGAARGNT